LGQIDRYREQYISVKIFILACRRGKLFLGQSIGIDENNTFQLKFCIYHENCRRHRVGRFVGIRVGVAYSRNKLALRIRLLYSRNKLALRIRLRNVNLNPNLRARLRNLNLRSQFSSACYILSDESSITLLFYE